MNASVARRLRDAVEEEKTFEIQIAGERIYIPPYAMVEFKYQREDEEVETAVTTDEKQHAQKFTLPRQA